MTEQDYNKVMRVLSAFLAGRSGVDLQRFYITQISIRNARIAAKLRAEREEGE